MVGWEEKFENKAKRNPARLRAGAKLRNKFNYIKITDIEIDKGITLKIPKISKMSFSPRPS